MKILVTGGAGYIGSIVASELLKLNHSVRVLDDLSTGNSSAIPTSAEFIQGSILDSQITSEALRGVEAVIHFAAKSLVGESMQNPDLYWRNNLEGTRNLLENMRIADVKKIVFSSTAAVYGDPISSPITEDSPTHPKNPYGESKLAVDNLLSAYCKDWGFGAISLRYFNVAGAVDGKGEMHNPETHLIPRALNSLIEQNDDFEIYGDDWPTPDGTCIRDYIHVYDLAQAHISALNRIRLGEHLVLNLGTESGASVREVISAIEKVTGHKLNQKIAARRLGDPAVLVASNKKAREELNWRPERTLTDIIADTYQFIRLSR